MCLESPVFFVHVGILGLILSSPSSHWGLLDCPLELCCGAPSVLNLLINRHTAVRTIFHCDFAFVPCIIVIMGKYIIYVWKVLVFMSKDNYVINYDITAQ